MEDLIKRSDAIKAIDDLPNAYDEWGDAYDKAYIIETLEEVPAVEPWDLYDCDEWCRDCKEYDTEKHNCPRWNRVIRSTIEENKVVNCCGCVHWIEGKCEKLKIPTEDFFFCGWGERGKQ